MRAYITQGLRYLPHRRAAKAERSLRIRTISLETSLLANTDYGSRGRCRPVLPNMGNISYSRELYLFSKFLHFEEIVRVKMAVCFEMIVSETETPVQLFKNMSFVADFDSKVELLLS